METRLIIKNVIYTPREVDVMSCIVMGISDTKTIALILEFSTSTVEKHIHSIIRKMSVNSRKMIVIILQNDKSYKFLKKHYILLKEKFLINHRVSLACDKPGIICNRFLEGEILGFFKLFLLKFLNNAMRDMFVKQKSKNFFEINSTFKRKNYKKFFDTIKL